MRLLAEPDYSSVLPEGMDDATRANVIEGFRSLNRRPWPSPDLSDAMGVILADAKSLHLATVQPKDKVLAMAVETEVHLPLMALFAAMNKTNALGVLIMTPHGEGFVEMRVEFTVMRKPEGEPS